MRTEVGITVCSRTSSRTGSRTRSRTGSSGRRSLVVVADAVDVAVVVDGEGNAVQSLGANDAAEAAGVVGVAQGLQDLEEATQGHAGQAMMVLREAFISIGCLRTRLVGATHRSLCPGLLEPQVAETVTCL